MKPLPFRIVSRPGQVGKIRKMEKGKVTTQQRACVIWDAFDRFVEIHVAAVPGWLAALKLLMTPQGDFQASERGWSSYFQHGRNRLYSRKDIVAYRYAVCRKFNDYNPVPPHKPGLALFKFNADTPRKRALRRAAEEKNSAPDGL